VFFAVWPAANVTGLSRS